MSRGTARAIGAAALLLASASQAQSVNDYQLPPSRPTPTPSPRVQGPVDSEVPAAAPQPPTPAPTTPAAAPPRIELPPPPASPATEGRTAPPRARPTGQPNATVAETPASVAGVTASEAAQVPTFAPPPPMAPAPPPLQREAEAASSDQPLWLMAGGAILLLLAGAVLWARLRRRRGATQEYEDTSPALAEAEPTSRAVPEPSAPATLSPLRAAPARPAPTPAPTPRAEPVPQPEPLPAPEPLATSGPLDITLEARHLSRAMVNATLAYRLSLTNRSDHLIGPLRITGDLTTAHASVPIEQQLSLDGANLAAIHEVPDLAPGASTTLTGELRLPIAEIRPIRGGQGHVFVPLARFHVAGEGATGDPVSATRIFVIGRTSEDTRAPLRPFVLEQGPGVQREIGQRELRGTVEPVTR